MDLRPGDAVSGYAVLRRLGRGGMGVVYLVRDEARGTLHALKVLRYVDPRLAARLRAEGRLQGALDHPNLVRVTGTVEVNGLPGLVMDYVPGPTLARLLELVRPLAIAEVDALGRGLLRGVAAAHAAGRVHRDLKPDNVLLALHNDRIVPRVADFGLAAALDEGSGEPGTLTRRGAGTRRYMSLEQLVGARPEPAMDVFALGAVLYELLEGVPAFASAHAWQEALRSGRIPVPSRPDVPARMRDAVRCALADRAARDPDAGVLLARWEAGTAEPEAFRPETVALVALASAHPAPEEVTAGRADPAHLAVCAACRAETEPAAFDTWDSARPPVTERDGFVGREADLAQLAEGFAAGHRLVTVHGTAGIGKTRLAFRFARTCADRWPGGVWIADLSEAVDADGVVRGVGRALGLVLDAADPVAQVGHAIAGRGRCLVVLDNFEQVVRHAAATVSAWSATAPEARFLVTSRVVLGIRGERVLGIEPLSDEDAVALFVQRARAASPSFDSDEDPDGTRRLVSMLDGLPLAIELCAARVRLLSPARIAERMGDRFRILAGARRDGPGRHATLRAALDASWELLAPWERSGLSQCAVFAGGFDLRAAEQVLDLSPWPEAPWPMDVLQALVDASLVRRVGGDRFDLLVSVRDYAVQRGAEAAEAARRRHAEWYTALADAADLRASPLISETDNLYAAARWAMAAGATDIAARAAAGAATAAIARGHLPAAEDLLRAVRDLPLSQREAALVDVALGRILELLGRIDEARARSASALAAYRAVGDAHGEAIARGDLGIIELAAGDRASARENFEAALAVHRAHGDRSREARMLGGLAAMELDEGRIEGGLEQFRAALEVAASSGSRFDEGVLQAGVAYALSLMGRHAEALEVAEQAIAIHRETGNRRHEARMLQSSGTELQHLGRIDEAVLRYEEAARAYACLGDPRSEGVVLGNVAPLWFRRGRTEEAERALERSIALTRQTGNRRAEALARMNLAFAYLRTGRPERVAEQLEAALARAREVGVPRLEGMVLARIGEIRGSLGAYDEAFAALDAAEPLLAASDDSPTQLAVVASIRARVCAAAGDPSGARAALEAAEAWAAQVGPTAPDSPLGVLLAEARAAVLPG